MAATASRDAKREGGVVTTVAGHAAHWPTGSLPPFLGRVRDLIKT